MLVDVDEDVTLGVESLGDTDAPALLLIAGGGWSMDWWDDDLCARLVDRGLRVIRYDHRDTGVSTSWPAGAPGYTGWDLVTDAIAVLDALGVERAHVCGLSMGGGIAQRLALGFRDRVAALTLIATSPIDPAVGDLPGPTPAIEAVFAGEGPEVTDPVEALVEGERPFAGPDAFDEARTRAIATRVLARSRDVAAAGNHFVIETGPMGPTDLGALDGVPTLVVHGGADPLFPPAHGRALAAAIPGARLLELPAMGHQLPPRDTWDELVDALLARHAHR
ncbi:alpha/beta fold hydrolase [Actinomycetospora lutea]|uniref:alpha/beta fold hydrolase n=1 Tax=Actinomycetospora lutea TaxID=663604 RepID=UPI00236569D1|nr:alpha/beta fold hydrolase [Actinomycetospora lutea]MDD7942537.1 alpha/beta fold hydrolase [Actinomycetospora lutea]